MKKSIIILTTCFIFFSLVTTSVNMVAQQTSDKKNEVVYPAKNADNYQSGEKWKMIWSDEFDGAELNLKNWTRQILPNPYNDEWQQYFDRKENAYVDDGYLVLKAIHTSNKHGDNQYTSARLHTNNKQTWKYGKIAARIQLPYGKGVWPAFWMLGANIDETGGNVRWPKCGEIDILELYGTRDDAKVEANIHFDDGGHKMLGAKSYSLKKDKFADEFHVFELEWNKEKLIWSVDGKPYCTVDITDPSLSEFHEKFYVIFNIAIGGNYAGRPDKSTPFPQLMYVDWIRVYKEK